VYLTYERPSTPSPNGRPANAPTCGFAPQAESRGSYSGTEIAERTGVPYGLVGDAAYAAIDVVRFAVVARLMRSGVPVARATALVRAAESPAVTTI
jgi:hypothetical protein